MEGRAFHRGAIAELLPEQDRADLDASLDAIVGRGLIRPARPEFANERAYAFDHILIRDATYNLIPKRLRADLHERHAAWLEHRSDQELGEHEELAGYHLERAYRYRVELEPAAPDRYRQLAMNGADHLGTAGRAALARDDTPAAIKLLERAVALLPEDAAERGALMPELGTALTEAGQLPEAERILDTAVGEAASRSNARAEAHATVARLFVLLQVDTEAGAREVRERFDSLLATFEAAGDDLGLGRLWRLRALVHWIEARSASADGAWERAAEHSRLAADERGWSESLSWLASSARIGPTPVEDAIARCASIREQLSGHRRELALVLDHVAALLAMRGEFGNARRLLAESKAIMAELGVTIHTAVSHDEAFVAFVSGDLAGAEAVLRAGHERLAEMGEKALLATTAAMLAEVIYEQGRMDDAWDFTQASEAAAAADDVSAQITWRAVRAQILARRGEMAEAKRLSGEAVSMAAGTDWLTNEGDALMSRAHVLRMAGESRAAAESFERAVALYAKKGNTVAVQHASSAFGDSVPV